MAFFFDKYCTCQEQVLLLWHQNEIDMAIDNRKRHVISIDKMPPEAVAAFNEKYPGGIMDCEDDLQQYHKPSGEVFYAVTIETADDIYMVKIPVEVDSIEDVQKWLDTDEDSVQASPDNEPEDNTLPDDNISQYKGEDSDDDE